MEMVKGYKMEFLFSPRVDWSAVPKPISKTAPASVRRVPTSISFCPDVVITHVQCGYGDEDMDIVKTQP